MRALITGASGNVGRTILRPGFFAQNLGDAYRRDIVRGFAGPGPHHGAAPRA